MKSHVTRRLSAAAGALAVAATVFAVVNAYGAADDPRPREQDGTVHELPAGVGR